MQKTGDFKKTEWTAVLTLYQLDLWEENIDGLRGARKNTHIHIEMGEKLGVTGAEIKNKLDSLTKKYRKEQALVGPSGGAPSTWEHFERVNKILATSKAINYKRVMVESTDFTPLHTSGCIDVESSEDSRGEASSSQGKRRQVDKLERMLEIEERKLEALYEMTEEMKLFHEKVFQALEKNNNK